MPVFEHENRVEHGELNGVKFVARNVAPYGFWTISPATGSAPKELQGSWTTIVHAKEAFENWSHNKKLDKKIAGE